MNTFFSFAFKFCLSVALIYGPIYVLMAFVFNTPQQLVFAYVMGCIVGDLLHPASDISKNID